MAKISKNTLKADHIALKDMHVRKGSRSRKLTSAETEYLIKMFAAKVETNALDSLSLAPAGSILMMAARHFDDTDISYALPIMQTIMIAASKLTQTGALLEVPGLGKIIPTLWTVGLDESGGSKTLAADEIWTALGGAEKPPVQKLPDSASDAQWMIDLADHNGSYWQQDEVGKRFNAFMTEKTWARLKPWLLNAYSYEAIGNRLKSEKDKLEIESPHFTFHGLSVFSTWKDDIDASSMLDGFCQRFNYYIADSRTDTDMYDHFLYFVGDQVDKRRRHLKSTWNALCNQPNAFGVYTLDNEVLPFLDIWWQNLRDTIGQSGLPASFVRRIGFSIMRYLIVLQFLLGKSRAPVDLETAMLATKFAEYHMQSALILLQDYNQSAATHVQKVASLRNDILASGGSASPRNISRRLSKSQRQELPTPVINQIVEVLNKLESSNGLFEVDAPREVKSNAMIGHRNQIEKRLTLNERKRNERRLRNLRSEVASTLSHNTNGSSAHNSNDSKVVTFKSYSEGFELDIVKLMG